MRTKEERKSLHRSQLVEKNSLDSGINQSAARAAYIKGPQGVYKNIKIDGSDFYIKLETDQK
tara:strand:+ start:350 stop:535 length:186 start_codon:yes stop_codon:yes gene_type:complete